MARYCGRIGFASNEKTKPGRWEEQITERRYYGDVTRAVRRLENGADINDNISINNEISIVADPYAREHVFAIRYAEWMGTKWKVSNAEILHPRIILTLGGVWNGNT